MATAGAHRRIVEFQARREFEAFGSLLGAVRPWRVAALPAPGSRLDRILVWLVPAVVLVASRLVFTWFAAPAHLLVTLGGWALFALVVRLVVGRRDPFHLWAVVGGVALLRGTLLLAALAGRGPGRYWFAFWTALALLPWGLSRILGITVYLGIPADLPGYAAVAGAALAAAGLLLSLGRGRRTA
ncbi:hypothetical protein B0E53_00219 [Micromonospora sp. MH33]|uniref:hypothetical protein n=1 Tax=Micromonospora sp. MH33 TaxID=1945509 RepID=UPI000D2691F1|nr:hypothetical protein [Micromonospora sp. MH33]PSK67748.1 hypothetical protein B0E53_00219 [Micromonospora sp. MH33]